MQLLLFTERIGIKKINNKDNKIQFFVGAFLLTPSHELSMERAALICEKMNFKGCFSLTKTATGILFKFSSPEDYQAVFKKGFHKVTGARFYRKVRSNLFKFVAISFPQLTKNYKIRKGCHSMSTTEDFHPIRVGRARRFASRGRSSFTVSLQLGR